jgi:hypothetical protein
MILVRSELSAPREEQPYTSKDQGMSRRAWTGRRFENSL